jgi:hypothetical protein
MNRGRRLFAGASAVFAILLIMAIWDISRRTSFPGDREKDYKRQVTSDSSAEGGLRPKPDTLR